MGKDYLRGLNDAQLQAVKHPPTIPLQILAGPGSGKTKVLTSRIAHLITAHAVPPEAICAVTFTNKAANEMKERLCKLLGEKVASKIKVGTFHALCAQFLRKHATLVGIGTNFTVCDADESKRIVTKLLKPFSDYLNERNATLKESTVMSRISKAKAKGLTHKDLAEECKVVSKNVSAGSNPLDSLQPSQVIAGVTAEIYKKYQRELKRSNSLDFDDLLVYGVQLFRDHPQVAKWCQHVLVDEFQDTNTMQYQLMTYIASTSKCVSIVGDPDQSIYGWRSAEVENLARMQKDFKNTKQIYLEENYRSTAAILAASVAIISLDKSRIPKTLRTSHAAGPSPVLRPFPSEQAEASSIASEIKRMMAHTGGMLSYSNFAILLRMNSLSRAMESALQTEGIPHLVLGGHRFFERMEVKDLIAYLQVIDNPQFVPAFIRIINVPSRAIGEKTITELLAEAEKLSLSPLKVIEGIHDGKIPDIKPAIKRKIAPLVKAIRALCEMAHAGESPGVILRRLLKLIEYEEHLKKNYDWETRWENVEELVNFASKPEYESVPESLAVGNPRDPEAEDDWMDAVDDEDVPSDPIVSPLRAFLQASMLATDTEAEKDASLQKDRVTIATCHAAKGLEWPVVFIPAVEQGIFPSSRAEDIEEERRLLYVACTRAQGLLYLSHCSSRMIAGSIKPKSASDFVTGLSDGPKKVFTTHVDTLSAEDLNVIATVLGCRTPGSEQVQRCVNEYRTRVQFRPSEHSFSTPAFQERPLHHRRSPSRSPSPKPYANFTSAKLSVPSHYLNTGARSYIEPLGPARPGANAPSGRPASSNKPSFSSSSSKIPAAHPPAQYTSNTYVKPSNTGVASSKGARIKSPRRAPTDHSEDSWIPEVSMDAGGVYRASGGAKAQALRSTSLARPHTSTAPSVAAPSSSRSREETVSACLIGASSTKSTPTAAIPPITSQRNTNAQNAPPPLVKTAGVKRRLGMTGTFVGYTNKKFKPPSL